MHKFDSDIYVYLCVGAMFTISPGYWRSIVCTTDCVLLELTSVNTINALKATYDMVYTFLDRKDTNRARLCFPRGSTYEFGWGFVEFFTSYANSMGRLGLGFHGKFTFEEPSEGGTKMPHWRQSADYYKLYGEEMEKVGNMSLVCGITRGMLHENAIHRLTLRGQKPRNVGRLIKWCQVHLGETFYKMEHVRAKARGRGDREMPDLSEGPVGDVLMRPYDPRWAPPAPSSESEEHAEGQVGGQVVQVGAQAGEEGAQAPLGGAVGGEAQGAQEGGKVAQEGEGVAGTPSGGRGASRGKRGTVGAGTSGTRRTPAKKKGTKATRATGADVNGKGKKSKCRAFAVPLLRVAYICHCSTVLTCVYVCHRKSPRRRGRRRARVG
jgi:hypothetical protein